MREPLIGSMHHICPMYGANAALYALVLDAISRPKSTLATRSDWDSIQCSSRYHPTDL